MPRRQPQPARRPVPRAAPAALALAAALTTTLAACAPAAGPDAPATTGTAAPTDPAPADPAPAPSTTPPEPRPTASPAPRTLLLATQAESDTLALVDPRDRDGSAVVDEITVGAAPWDVAVRGDRAFVSTARGVAVVDLATRERTALLGYAHRPDKVAYGEYRPGGLGLAVSRDGRTVHVAVSTGGESFLETIDVASGEVVSSVPVGLRPFDVLLSADGDEVYTIDHDAFTVTVVDARTFDTRTVQVAPFGTEGGLASFEKPHYAVLAPGGDLLLPYQGRALAHVDPDTGEVTTTPLEADTHQHGVARAGDGTLVIAGNGPFGNAASGASIEVVAPDGTSTVLPTDRRHETATIWTDRGEAYGVLSGGYTQSGAWDGMTVVPLDDPARSYEIRVPGRPQTVAPVTLPTEEGPA